MRRRMTIRNVPELARTGGASVRRGCGECGHGQTGEGG